MVIGQLNYVDNINKDICTILIYNLNYVRKINLKFYICTDNVNKRLTLLC